MLLFEQLNVTDMRGIRGNLADYDAYGKPVNMPGTPQTPQGAMPGSQNDEMHTYHVLRVVLCLSVDDARANTRDWRATPKIR